MKVLLGLGAVMVLWGVQACAVECVSVNGRYLPIGFPHLIKDERNSPGGTIFASVSVDSSLRCDGVTAWKLAADNAENPVSKFDKNTLETNIPGVGLRWTSYTDAAQVMTTRPLSNGRGRGVGRNEMSISNTFELVKIGRVVPGSYSLRPINMFIGAVESGEYVTVFNFPVMEFKQPSCYVSGPSSVSVSLGRKVISLLEAEKLGARFFIDLKCPVGERIKIKFEADKVSPDGVIGLSADSTAKNAGVLVGMRDAGGIMRKIEFNEGSFLRTVEPNEDVSRLEFTALYAPEILGGSSAEVGENIKKIQPGTANASLTFTLVYD